MTKLKTGETKMKMRTVMSIALSLLLGCCMPGFAGKVGPDAAGYTGTDQATVGFQNITSGGIRILAGVDDAFAAVNLPFTFQFYGQNYTSVCISTNGLLAFGSCNADFANVDLSSGSPSGDARIAAPLWTDLSFEKTGSDAVYYQALGSAPNRVFVVQWNSALPLNASGAVTFQALLYETSNKIVFQYDNVGACNYGASATVGIRDSAGHLNNRRVQWSYNAAVLKNAFALEFAPPGAVVPVTQYDVTAAVSPAGAGTVAGAGKYNANSTATLTAAANAGYQFSHWSGGVATTTANPLTFTVTGAKSVVANFVATVPSIAASVVSKSGTVPTARVWVVQLKNNGKGAAADAQVSGLTFTQVPGATCAAPSAVTVMPVNYGLLSAGGGLAQQPVTITFGDCVNTAQFTVQVRFSANSGAYNGSTTLYNQFR